MIDFSKPILKIRRKLRSSGVRRIGIFGSMARGTARAGSDIDVLVDLDPQKGTLRDLCDISDALEVAFGRRVDLVPSDSLDKYIGPEILRTVKYVKID